MAGKTPGAMLEDGDEAKKLDDFTAKTYGFRLGGPIIKNKLFFFVNAEFQRDETPKPFNFDDYTGDSDAAALDAFTQKLLDYTHGRTVFIFRITFIEKK